MQRKDDRTRVWTFVCYPESVREGWRDALDELHIAWAESPLHDKDTNADGSAKKPHWHVLLVFDGKKSYEQVSEITDSIGATIPQRCASAKGLVRYMAHLDNPDKAQYSTADIIGHGGLDVAEYLRPTSATRYEMIREMMDYIAANDIIEMEDLLLYAAHERYDDWFPLLCDSCAYVIGAMLKSRRHRADRQVVPEVRVVRVSETGEILPDVGSSAAGTANADAGNFSPVTSDDIG